MPSTHTSLYYHLVFSTKNREPWLEREIRPQTHAFLGGCVRSANGIALEIGGVADHVHLLVSLRATHRLSDLLRDIKQASSEWFHEQTRRRAFAWQEGYGAFTVSLSAVERVREYIRDQEAHHINHSFQDEYRLLLEKHEIEFDDRFLW